MQLESGAVVLGVSLEVDTAQQSERYSARDVKAETPFPRRPVASETRRVVPRAAKVLGITLPATSRVRAL
jgi:hypothetical protein